MEAVSQSQVREARTTRQLRALAEDASVVIPASITELEPMRQFLLHELERPSKIEQLPPPYGITRTKLLEINELLRYNRVVYDVRVQVAEALGFEASDLPTEMQLDPRDVGLPERPRRSWLKVLTSPRVAPASRARARERD